MNDEYSQQELHDIMAHRLELTDYRIPQNIESFGMYFRMMPQQYPIIIDEILHAFNANLNDNEKQISYVYLVNEIMQNEKPENIPQFKVLFERMMIKVAETRDKDHIKRAKRVLEILLDRKILDRAYNARLLELMDNHEATGADEDTTVGDQFLGLTEKLAQAKRTRMKLTELNAEEDEIIQAVKNEIAIRDSINAFHTKQMLVQSQKMEYLNNNFLAKQNKINEPSFELDLGDDSDDDDGPIL